MTEEIAPIPPRPWTVQQFPNHLRIGSKADDGSVDETVFTIDLDGAHLPSELARAWFIVNAVNSYTPSER
jgi:hypothetical protein